jgi:hypothetical protein
MAICSSLEGMTAAAAYAEAVARRAHAVLSQAPARREIFSIGELSFELSGPNAPDSWLGHALMPGPPRPSGSLHRVMVWDGISPASLPPEPPWTQADYSPLGVVEACSDESFRCAFDVETNALLVCNLAKKESQVWFPNIAQLPDWAKAAPFRTLLSWLCNQDGMQMVHGAGVSVGDKAVLLAGKGGSGKSTTALACALAGMGFLGDDYCAVDPRDNRIHMVYRSAKVFPPSLGLLPALASLIASRGEGPLEKDIVYLDAADAHLVRSATLSAILLPRIGTERETKISSATSAEATKAILPTTYMQLMGGTAVTAGLIMQLTRNLPAFHLELGTDIGAVPDAIARMLA